MNQITPMPPAFANYKQKQFDAQHELTGDDKRLLSFIHWCDWKNEQRGCRLTNLELAESLTWSFNQVRKRTAKLKKLGYLVTMEYLPRGDAVRRVVLKTAIKSGVKGASFEVVINGRKYWRKRKTSEENPALCLAQVGMTPAPLGVHICVRFSQSKTPLPSSGEEGNDPDSFGPNRSVVSFQDTTVSRPTPPTPVPSLPADTQTPSPSTPAPTAKYRFSREAKWLLDLAQYPVLPLLAKFGVKEIFPRFARSAVKAFRGGKIHPASLDFVLGKLDTLPKDPSNPAHRPDSVEDFIRRFIDIRDWLVRTHSSRMIKDLTRELEDFSTPVDAKFGYNWASGGVSIDKALTPETYDGNPLLKQHAWAVAHQLLLRGHSARDTQLAADALAQLVKCPALLDWGTEHLTCDLAAVIGFSAEEVRSLRAKICVMIQRALQTLKTPSLDRVQDLTGFASGFTEAVCQSYVEHNELPDLGLVAA